MVEIQDATLQAVDRLNDGIVIKFEDGRCTFFSTAYLSSKCSEGVLLDETLSEW